MGDRRCFLERCGQFGTLFAVERVAEMLRDGRTKAPRTTTFILRS